MLPIDVSKKRVFVAGIGDDQGFGWAIAKALHQAGASILIGTWVPMFSIFTQGWKSGKFDASRRHPDGTMFEFEHVYPIDAAYDTGEEVPEEIAGNKRYKNAEAFTISEVVDAVCRDYGSIDILIHSLANSPEIKNSLLNTSRSAYLSAINTSTYSFISLLSHFAPHMNAEGSALNLSYLASERAIPGYGGGMSSAKAALESDTRTLAYEAGRQYGIRVNTIRAGAYSSRAAKAIGFIDRMIRYSEKNAPLHRSITAEEIGNVAAFLCSNLASAITGAVIDVDCGLHAMGMATDEAVISLYDTE